MWVLLQWNKIFVPFRVLPCVLFSLIMQHLLAMSHLQCIYVEAVGIGNHHHFWQAQLRVCSAERRHQFPEWTVLSQVNCVIHRKWLNINYFC